MKKILSFIAGFLIVSGAFSGCVEDNQYIVLRGITSKSCEPTGSNQTYGGTCGMSSTRKMKDGSIQYVDNRLYAHITNDTTGNSPWSSSGSSSSGSTFEGTIPNAGLIYADEIIIRCESINGDKDACKGKDPIKQKINSPVEANGGACLGFDASEAEAWGDHVEISVQVSYHDPSYIKGKTGKAEITFSSSLSYNEDTHTTNPCAPDEVQEKEEEDSSSSSDSGTNPSGGGEDQKPDQDDGKKKSGESCSEDIECKSGKCVEKIDGDTAQWVCE